MKVNFRTEDRCNDSIIFTATSVAVHAQQSPLSLPKTLAWASKNMNVTLYRLVLRTDSIAWSINVQWKYFLTNQTKPPFSITFKKITERAF